MPKVSVVIPTRNEALNIGNCLDSLEKQSYKDFETIIVDNYSPDGTVEISKRHTAKLYSRGPERSEQRNFGASQSQGQYLFFVDADMAISFDVIKEAVEVLDKNKNIDALVVPEISVGKGFWTSCRILEKRLYFGDEFIEAPRFFRREKFLDVGGYSRGMISGEDWDLRDRFLAKGYKVGRISSLIYHNEGNLKFWPTLKKKAFYASHSRPYLSANPLTPAKVFRFVFRRGFFINFFYILKDPVHFLGLLILKAGESMAGLIGFLSHENCADD